MSSHSHLKSIVSSIRSKSPSELTGTVGSMPSSSHERRISVASCAIFKDPKLDNKSMSSVTVPDLIRASRTSRKPKIQGCHEAGLKGGKWTDSVRPGELGLPSLFFPRQLSNLACGFNRVE